MCCIQNVSKVYGNGFHAVKNISCGIPAQECFGLLGQNGAGKTTAFKMLTGDEILTTGNAYLNRFSVKKDIKQVIIEFIPLGSNVCYESSLLCRGSMLQ